MIRELWSCGNLSMAFVPLVEKLRPEEFSGSNRSCATDDKKGGRAGGYAQLMLFYNNTRI
jgi:hypothetical protein